MAWGIYYNHGRHTELLEQQPTAQHAFARVLTIANDLAWEAHEGRGSSDYDYSRHLAHMSIRGNGVELYRIRLVVTEDYDLFWERYGWQLKDSRIGAARWMAVKATTQLSVLAIRLDDLLFHLRDSKYRPYNRFQIYQLSKAMSRASWVYKCLIRAKRSRLTDN